MLQWITICFLLSFLLMNGTLMNFFAMIFCFPKFNLANVWVIIRRKKFFSFFLHFQYSNIVKYNFEVVWDRIKFLITCSEWMKCSEFNNLSIKEIPHEKMLKFWGLIFQKEIFLSTKNCSVHNCYIIFFYIITKLNIQIVNSRFHYYNYEIISWQVFSFRYFYIMYILFEHLILYNIVINKFYIYLMKYTNHNF